MPAESVEQVEHLPEVPWNGGFHGFRLVASRRLRQAGRAGRVFLSVMRANPLSLAGFVLVVLIVGTAIVVAAVPAVTGYSAAHPLAFRVFGTSVHYQLFSHTYSVLPYDPNQVSLPEAMQGPTWAHPFGTDIAGRDVFSRVLAALPTDLFIGVAIAAFALAFGGGLGLVAGYWDTPRTAGGVASSAILRVTDIFLAFPSLVLALAVAATLRVSLGGELSSMLAVMLTWWPFYVRLTRGEVLVVKQQAYVTAARAAGVSDTRILGRHVLRNLLEPLAVYFTLDIGTVIVTYSTISYIGIGVPDSIPEWGNMIEHYQDFLLTAPWMLGFVALAIFVTVLGFSLMGDGLRDVLDPRSRRILATKGMDLKSGVVSGAG